MNQLPSPGRSEQHRCFCCPVGMVPYVWEEEGAQTKASWLAMAIINWELVLVQDHFQEPPQSTSSLLRVTPAP